LNVRVDCPGSDLRAVLVVGFQICLAIGVSSFLSFTFATHAKRNDADQELPRRVSLVRWSSVHSILRLAVPLPAPSTAGRYDWLCIHRMNEAPATWLHSKILLQFSSYF
jgi:hypothetical protein